MILALQSYHKGALHPQVGVYNDGDGMRLMVNDWEEAYSLYEKTL